MFPIRQLARHASVVFAWAVVTLGAPAVFAQAASPLDTGTINGLVTDLWEGRPMAGVVVVLRGTTLAATTDASGRYTLAGVPPGEHIVTFSRSGFARATITEVRVAAGQATKVDLNLRPEFYEMEEYQITAEELAEQNVAILQERQKSAIMQDSLGSEFLSRIGASDAAEAASKVTGVSVVGGKFVVIRGLSDRYTSTTLNGGEVPTADPYRKAVQLDLFPSAMIQELVISKTFTPDQPGGFTGGAVNVVTKSFPEQFVFNFSAGVSYNTQGSLIDDFLTSDGGSTDWLGLDDGTREIPGLVDETPPQSISRPTPLTAPEAELRERVNKSFKSFQLSPEEGDSLLGHNFALSLGDTFKVFERRVGYFAGINYDRDFNHYDNGINQRFDTGGPVLNPSLLLDDVQSVEEISWSALASVSLELLAGHEVGVNFIFNQVAEDIARSQSGTYKPLEDNRGFVSEVIQWRERQLQTLQFRGDHRFPALADAHLGWLASFAETSQNEPDLRFFAYLVDVVPGVRTNYTFGDPSIQPSRPSRYFRELEESNENFKLDGDVPFSVWRGLEGKVKAGAFHSQSDRTYIERALGYFSDNGYATFNRDQNAENFLTLSNLTARPVGNNFRFNRYIVDLQNTFNYEGFSTVQAAYGMLEMPLLESLRFVGGARVESTDLEVTTLNRANGTSETGQIQQTDVLPALSLIYTPMTNMNIRLSYSHTIARPTFREFSPAETFDFVGGDTITGNPNLAISQVRNYDLRWEWFRRPGEVFAFSLFYKDIQEPIEFAQTQSDPIKLQYINSPKATVFGVEVEARTALDIIDPMLKEFSLGANFTYVQSEVDRSPAEIFNRRVFSVPGDETRPLYDQSPYIANADLSYDNASSGTTVSLVFNIAGPRLTFAGYTVPDVYEEPAPRLDFFISQRLGKRWKVRFSARNLLNPEVKRVYDFTGSNGEEYTYSSFTRGIEFGLSASCSY
jgi:hypothetical protein